MVSSRLLRATQGGRRRGAESAWTRLSLRSGRTDREEAGSSGRFVPLLGSILLALYGRHSWQGRGHHRQQSCRLPVCKKSGTSHKVRNLRRMMRTARRRNGLVGMLVLALAASLLCALNARGQSDESIPAPLAGQFVGEPSPVFESALAVLDLPDRVLDKIQYSNSWFTVKAGESVLIDYTGFCLLYTSPSPRDQRGSRMPSSA